MRLVEHPQYQSYVQAQKDEWRCRRAIAHWQACGEPIIEETFSLSWTPESARALVRSISRMFDEYNRVVWTEFPYCRQCGGQCCKASVSYVTPFDLIAQILLDQSLPELPEEIEATAEDCIYRTSGGCAWPENWKPIMCWSYYCLGRGDANLLGSLDALHDPITERLEVVIRDLLPDELHRYEQVYDEPLSTHLGEPLDLDNVLGDALFEIFLAPFNDRYAVIDV